MYVLIVVGPQQSDSSDWFCLEFPTGRKLYARLPLTSLSDGESLLSNVLKIESDIYELVMATNPSTGQPISALVSLKEQPPDCPEPPYYVNMANVVMFAAVSPESKLAKALRSKETGIVEARPPLVYPG